MCNQKAVPFDTLSETNLNMIKDAYVGTPTDKIRLVPQIDGSIWMLTPSEVSSMRQRRVIPLAKHRTNMLYKTEVPSSFLQAVVA
jgi:hypothetical protein